ncbi:FAD binding domain-containing protein [Seiridium cupressi]
MDVKNEVAPHLHDVLIIGGGPCGLAVASRLSEHMPAASFTDDEHNRYHWLKKRQDKVSIKAWRTGIVKSASMCGIAAREKTPDTVVLDATGDRWMARWDYLFKTFGITHLRSPMFFHIDPAERDGLLSYTHMNGRGNELTELRGCVGKEMSKHKWKKRVKSHREFGDGPTVDERDRNDYFVPSTPLFASHCGCIIDRYGLRQDIVRQEKALDIKFDYFDDVHPTEKVFRIETDKRIYYSRTTVLAVGPANEPVIPSYAGVDNPEATTHALKIKEFPSQAIRAKIAAKRTTNVLIVGGGLTSAQLADLALRKGVTRVWLIMRRPLKVKYFDIGLEWVGKFRNFEQAAFWTADSLDERWDMIKTARNGGSITPPYKKILDRLVANGKVVLSLHTTIKTRNWNEATQTWDIELSGGHPQKLPPIDHIYFATGVQSNFKSLPYLQSLLAQYPIEDCGGMPCITEDMQWSDEVPLFMAGRLGALQLGPGAPNLVGARIGAERISWAIQELLSKDENGQSKVPDSRFDYLTARGSRYEALAEE